MEHLIEKVTCIIVSIIGGLCNYHVKKNKGRKPTRGGHINWLVERARARRDLGLNIVIAIISVVLFIPPIIHTFNLHITWAYALAFFIGYSGVKLVPLILDKIKKTLDKF
tara:strand:- start:126 stop:455 length:330 start_codon:yes stop_codon:yes gene_type:complete